MRTLSARSLVAMSMGAVLGLTAVALAQEALTIGPADAALTVEGTAGGAVHATRHGITDYGVCTGWIADTPNHTLTVSDTIPAMEVSVRSPSDTTLVIVGPGGELRCADDGDGPNPVLAGEWPAGTYELYVGSYARNETAPYTLSLTPQ